MRIYEFLQTNLFLLVAKLQQSSNNNYDNILSLNIENKICCLIEIMPLPWTF